MNNVLKREVVELPKLALSKFATILPKGNAKRPPHLLSELVFTGHSDGLTSGWSIEVEGSSNASLCPTSTHCISDGKQH